MMRSTQNNLENELALLQLDINADTKDGAIYDRRLTQYEYDHMDFHDSNCLYYIEGSNKTYIGDFEIQHPDIFGHRLAYITYDTNTKEFMVLRSMNIRGRNFYVTVNRWKDPQKAMNDLLMILHTSDDNAICSSLMCIPDTLGKRTCLEHRKTKYYRVSHNLPQCRMQIC